jgi:hypothetical protein
MDHPWFKSVCQTVESISTGCDDVTCLLKNSASVHPLYSYALLQVPTRHAEIEPFA